MSGPIAVEARRNTRPVLRACPCAPRFPPRNPPRVGAPQTMCLLEMEVVSSNYTRGAEEVPRDCLLREIDGFLLTAALDDDGGSGHRGRKRPRLCVVLDHDAAPHTRTQRILLRISTSG